jgi:hypothetical protein
VSAWWRHGFVLAGLCTCMSSDLIAQQVTMCGSARGTTPYSKNMQCIPKLTFHVSGHCLSACLEVTLPFTSPPAEARGNCNLIGGACAPEMTQQNVYDVWTREFFSKAANKTLFCEDGTEVTASSGECPCAACSGGVTPANNTGTGDDPLLISIDDTEYRLTSLSQGVKFDLDGDGELERTAWTSAGDDAFLVLDRNFNGTIDNGLEVFGDETPQVPSPDPNGFKALAVFDDPASGGNADGKIDAADSIFGWLMLWTDRNHNGRSESGELQSVEGVVTAIDLGYQSSLSHDEFGNDFRFWASIGRTFASEGAIVAWNVFFNKREPATKQ